MKLSIDLPFPTLEHPVDYSSHLLFLRSCFASAVGERFSPGEIRRVRQSFRGSVQPLLGTRCGGSYRTSASISAPKVSLNPTAVT